MSASIPSSNILICCPIHHIPVTSIHRKTWASKPSKMSKRKPAQSEDVDERHIMRIMPLGAGNEVGRSCIILNFKGKTIMLDCGVHPGYSGHGSLPFFDGVEAEEIDLLLITHFHIDHVAALPHFTEKTNFKGRVFMTHPQKLSCR